MGMGGGIQQRTKIPDCKVNLMRDGMANRERSNLGLSFAPISRV